MENSKNKFKIAFSKENRMLSVLHLLAGVGLLVLFEIGYVSDDNYYWFFLVPVILNLIFVFNHHKFQRKLFPSLFLFSLSGMAFNLLGYFYVDLFDPIESTLRFVGLPESLFLIYLYLSSKLIYPVGIIIGLVGSIFHFIKGNKK